MSAVTFTRHSEVSAVLADGRFAVPAMPPPGPDVDMAWLRATVSRFVEGETHARRRALGQAELDRMDPAALRADAARLARSLPPGEVAVAVLAAALGLPPTLYEPVSHVAAGYLPGTDAGPLGDDAVKQLVAACGGTADEPTAARLAILVQACQATATLIANAVCAWRKWQPAQATVAAVVAETLRFDPPVPAMRRVCVAPASIGQVTVHPDETVALDIAAANRDPDVFADPDEFRPGRTDAYLTFGAGLRPCPGRDHAFAIATGAVETIIEEARHDRVS